MVSFRVLLVLGLLAACARATGRPRGDVEDQPSDRAVTADDIRRAPGTPIEELLMSRFPGVVVTRAPDGHLAIRIRGTTSINASTEPLYVIDGVPIKAGPGGSLVGINPYDIESIEVLKDAASTAMYGMRGANGVVVIKTKRPDQ